MKKTVALFFLLWLSNFSFSQENIKIYDWNLVQNANPDTIFGISFKKMKLDSLPFSLSKFKNLKQLDVSFNKLKKLPDFITQFSKLENIDFSKNKFKVFPENICTIESLRRISFNRNEILAIPSSISKLKNLTYIDFWDNPIAQFPDAFLSLAKLKTIHAEGIMYGPKFQENWKNKLPDVTIFFDPPCDCRE